MAGANKIPDKIPEEISLRIIMQADSLEKFERFLEVEDGAPETQLTIIL